MALVASSLQFVTLSLLLYLSVFEKFTPENIMYFFVREIGS